MNRQDKTPKKKQKQKQKTKRSRDRPPFRKRLQNNESEDNLGSQKQNGKDARDAYQRPRRTKELTNRDE